MAGRIANQGNIVQDGLLFSIDSSKPLSYPKTGTIITNITNTSITGSLVNGPIFDPSGYGSIFLDGVDDYINLTNFRNYMISCTSAKSNGNIVGAQSLNIWFKISSTAAAVGTVLSFTDSSASNLAAVYVGQATSTYPDESIGVVILDGITGLNLSVFIRKGHTFLYDDKWHNFIYTTNSSGNNLYLDGILETPSYQTGTQTRNSVFNPYNVSQTNISFLYGARNIGSIGTYMKMNCRYFSVYNKALTQAEVTQNFNAMKGRYGL